MPYRKFKADRLFTGTDLLPGDMVLVTTEEGEVQAILPLADVGESLETYQGLISPGFVNCHCHLELSPMRGMISEGTGLVDFLLAVLRHRDASEKRRAGRAGGSDAGSVREAIERAETSMLEQGIVAVGDICNTTDTLPQKAEGRMYYHNFIEGMGFTPEAAPARFESICRVFASFAEAYGLPIEANSLAPHAPYSVSPELFGMIAGFPGNHLLSMHNQETEDENAFYLNGGGEFLRLYQAIGIDTGFFKGTGKRSLESCLPYFFRNQHLILVHNLFTSSEDLRTALSRSDGPDLFFCLCPGANRYISRQIPDPAPFMEQDATIVLGTDSLASNHNLSILDEMRTLQAHHPRLLPATLLKWATINGARALQMDAMLGSFERGKQPGVVLIENMEGEKFGPAASARRLL